VLQECPLILVQLDEQVEYNEYDLEDKYYNDAKRIFRQQGFRTWQSYLGRWNSR
jgi:hypothetical protein